MSKDKIAEALADDLGFAVRGEGLDAVIEEDGEVTRAAEGWEALLWRELLAARVALAEHDAQAAAPKTGLHLGIAPSQAAAPAAQEEQPCGCPPHVCTTETWVNGQRPASCRIAEAGTVEGLAADIKMRARECTSKLATPANWFALHAAIDRLAALASREAQPAVPPVKGAWIDGGYVIVTPAKGTDPKALKAAILAAASPTPPASKEGV